MRQKICKEVCPYCKSAENTIYKNKNQCYCKNCCKYFKPGSKRDEYSATSALVLNTILALFYPPSGIFRNFRDFAKKIKEKFRPNIHNVKLKYKVIPDTAEPEDTAKIHIAGNLKDSIILTRSGNDFIITKGLNVRQKIIFEDYIINTSAPGAIKREYDD